MGGLCVAALLLAPIAYSQAAFVTLQYPFTEVEWAIIAMALVSSTAYTMFLYVVKSPARYLPVWWDMSLRWREYSGGCYSSLNPTQSGFGPHWWQC